MSQMQEDLESDEQDRAASKRRREMRNGDEND